jgi:HD-GYP domain-containing protein (c-di-GMP phosphodiesterase class II)
MPKIMVEKRRFDYNDEEKSQYLKYPALSKKIALSLGDEIRKKCVEVIYQHKERLTGDGFPEKLKGQQIDELSLIIGLADDFELMISNETSASQKTPSEIMSRMSRMGSIYGEAIVDSFYTWFRYLK